MTPQKTQAIVLQTTPYRESSLIVRLYSGEFGMIQGIAKGVRAGRTRTERLERGMALDIMVYIKPGRSLQTLVPAATLDVFPVTRSDLTRTAFRDVGLELVLKSVHESEPERNLYVELHAYLSRLERAGSPSEMATALWRFCVRLSTILGFGLNLGVCSRCGGRLPSAATVVFRLEEGGFECRTCARTSHAAAELPAGTLARIAGTDDWPWPEAAPPGRHELCSVTHSLVTYLCHHSNARASCISLEFLLDILSTESA